MSEKIKQRTREDKLSLGQFFTEEREVDFMLTLKRNQGRILEPSCGDGAFLKKLPGHTIALEIDELVAPEGSIVIDFLDYSEENKFSSIIGNPPYVAHSRILEGTKKKCESYESWSGKTNLFVIFIEKSLNHLEEGGEIIFIVPSVFFKATSCKDLNNKMFSEGSVTDLVLYGDKSPFVDAAPEYETCIFRYQKGDYSRKTQTYKYSVATKTIEKECIKSYYVGDNGITFFFEGDVDVSSLYRIGDHFDVKVGGASGMDSFFEDNLRGNKDFVFSRTRQTGETRRMICEQEPTKWLKENVVKLVERRIKKVWTHKDWWKWGRPQPAMDGRRFYVNGKTRVESPFFTHESDNYDGAVLAIFPKEEALDAERSARVFNTVDWDMFSMKTGKRYHFKQRLLENCFLTKEQYERCKK